MGQDNVVPDGHLPASCELERGENENVSNDDLWRQLETIDSESAARIHPNDRRKVKRYNVFLSLCSSHFCLIG